MSSTGWFLRSMGDRDTHRGIYSPATRSVHARCGIEFEPLKRTTGAPIVLIPRPPDPDQVCLACSHGQGAR
jgi:hypothetical protein